MDYEFDNGFDADQEEPMQSFDVLPTDWYELAIVESEKRENSKGTGEYLKLVIEVLSGRFERRKLFLNLSLKHQNPTVVQMARKELAAIMRAIGKPKAPRSSDLHDLPFWGKIGCRKRKDDGEIENRFLDCANKRPGAAGVNPNVAPKPASSAPAAEGGAAPAPGPRKAPWQR